MYGRIPSVIFTVDSVSKGYGKVWVYAGTNLRVKALAEIQRHAVRDNEKATKFAPLCRP